MLTRFQTPYSVLQTSRLVAMLFRAHPTDSVDSADRIRSECGIRIGEIRENSDCDEVNVGRHAMANAERNNEPDRIAASLWLDDGFRRSTGSANKEARLHRE